MAANNLASKTEQLSNSNLMIVLLLISLLVVGGTVLVAKSMVTGIIRDTKVVTAKTKANSQLDDNVAAAPKLVEAYQNLGTQAGTIADALPNTSDFPALIALLENLSNDAGVKLKSVSPSLSSTSATGTTGMGATPAATSSTSAVATPQPFGFSVAADATYATLQRLLSNLETSARPMRVSGMQLSGSGSSLSVEIDGSTYYQDKAGLPITKETIK